MCKYSMTQLRYQASAVAGCYRTLHVEPGCQGERGLHDGGYYWAGGLQATYRRGFSRWCFSTGIVMDRT